MPVKKPKNKKTKQEPWLTSLLELPSGRYYLLSDLTHFTKCQGSNMQRCSESLPLGERLFKKKKVECWLWTYIIGSLKDRKTYFFSAFVLFQSERTICNKSTGWMNPLENRTNIWGCKGITWLYLHINKWTQKTHLMYSFSTVDKKINVLIHSLGLIC